MPEIYLVLAGILCAFMLTYYFRGGMQLNTCAGWAVLACIHGLLVKPLFVYFDFPSAELLDLALFQKLSRADYWYWAPFMLVPYGLFFTAMVLFGGYTLRPTTPPPATRVRFYSNGMLMMFLALAIAGIGGFFWQFPQLLGEGSKNAIASEDLSDYNGGGVWRVLVEIAYVVSICALVNIGARVRRRASTVLFFTAALVWLSFCFLSDQRGAMLFSMATYMVAYNRYIARLSRRTIVVAVVVAFALVVVRTFARLQVGDASAQETLGGTLSNFVGQNLIEHGKTITIIRSVPDVLSFQYGFTYLNGLLNLVPRAIFPDKTSVNLDTTIGNQVFDCGAFGACGVPPGLLAESYLNFGTLGLVLMPVLTGALVGYMDAKFRASERGSPFDVFFLYALLYLGMAFLGSGLSSSITSLATQSVTAAAIGFFSGRKLRQQPNWVAREGVLQS
jgi:oligosaccharide repeat unit polymerase